MDAEVARTAAIVYGLIDPPRAVAFWKEAYELSGERSDLVSTVRSAVVAREFDTAEEFIGELKALGPPFGEVLFQEARLRLLQGRVAEAIVVARRSLKEDGAPDDAPFLFIQLTQYAQDPAVRAEGIEYLRNLARSPDAIGLRALRSMGDFPENTPEELLEVINALRAHPEYSREDLLYALKLEMRLPDASAKANLRKAETLFDADDAGELTEFGRWLNLQHRYGQTIEIISEKEALTRKDLFLVWADALAALNQWDTIERVLADPRVPLDRYLLLLFRARVYLETGQRDRADFAWSRAVLQVANDPEKLWFLENYARKLGLFDQAREALERLTQLPSARRKAFERLVQLEQREGSVRTLRDTLKRMNVAYPRDLSVKNDLAYANLLLNENITQSVEAAEELVNDGSPYLANRVTLALAYYRMGQPARALEVLEPLEVDWSQARSGFRAVYAAILRANGRGADANALLVDLDLPSLLKEEQDLLGQTRG